MQELRENAQVLTQLRDLLGKIADTERIAARISTLRASPRDLLALARTLRQVPQLRGLLGQMRTDLLAHLAGQCDSMDELADLLESAVEPDCPAHLRDGGFIRSGFSQELDRLRSISTDGQSWLREYQKQESQRTGIANLKVGFNKVFGYYIEINNTASEKVPADYIRKQTVKNAERYITERLKEYENEVLTAEDRALELEQKLFENLRQESAKYVSRMQQLADTVAQCDCLTCLAHVAARRNFIRPKITDDARLVIREGKHPVLAEMLGAEFVPNDVDLGDGSGQIAVITGPNMSGKSTYIRQVALLVLMAQTGSFIPAKEAEIGLVDRIFTRVGASDELTRGQSTFMVEMTETANIINNATAKSLVILDEVGRGTSTYDGLSLAWAITEHLATTSEVPNPVRHALSRTDGTGGAIRQHPQLQRRGPRVDGRGRVPAPHPARRHGQKLRHPRREIGRHPQIDPNPLERDPRRTRIGLRQRSHRRPPLPPQNQGIRQRHPLRPKAQERPGPSRLDRRQPPNPPGSHEPPEPDQERDRRS